MKEAAIIQARVVGALMLRETRVRYGRSKFGYLWALLEPTAYLIALSIVFTYMHAHAPFGNSMPLFFALGILPFSLFRNLSNQLGAAFEANQALLSFPIVKEIDAVIARGVLEIATMLVVVTIVLFIIYTLGDVPPPNNLMKMMASFAGLSMFGFGLGLCNAVIISKISSWRNLFQMMTAPMLFLSGIFYSLESLPTKVQKILIWNPVIHGVEGMRDGYFLNYRASNIDLAYLYAWGLALILIGLAAERAIRIRRS